MSYSDTSSIQQFLRQQYGLVGSIESLPGERDQNVRVASDRGQFVLKIMHFGCDPALVDLQIQALTHLHEQMPEIPVPRVRKTSQGLAVAVFEDPAVGQRLAWLISELPGDVMAHCKPWSASTAASIGRALAQLDRALATFSHPFLQRECEWDLRQSGWLGERAQAITDVADRHIVDGVADDFEQSLSAQLDDLERAPIHGDGNDMNILLDGSSEASLGVGGIIDFGDMVATPRVCEPAIAAAYVMMGAGDGVARCRALINAYQQEYPLAPEELALVPRLIRLRWAVSVTNAAHNAKINPDNAYLGINQHDGLALLRRFADTIDVAIGAKLQARN